MEPGWGIHISPEGKIHIDANDAVPTVGPRISDQPATLSAATAQLQSAQKKLPPLVPVSTSTARAPQSKHHHHQAKNHLPKKKPAPPAAPTVAPHRNPLDMPAENGIPATSYDPSTRLLTIGKSQQYRVPVGTDITSIHVDSLSDTHKVAVIESKRGNTQRKTIFWRTGDSEQDKIDNAVKVLSLIDINKTAPAVPAKPAAPVTPAPAPKPAVPAPTPAVPAKPAAPVTPAPAPAVPAPAAPVAPPAPVAPIVPVAPAIPTPGGK